MNRRRFLVLSTVGMVLAGAVVAGLALYSTYVVRASIPDFPEALGYLPADCQAVFGMNVRKFIASPVYARFEARQGAKLGSDLAEFEAKTGVDPRRDISYIIAGGKSSAERKGRGAIVAVGRFNSAAIISYVSTRTTPVRADYKNTPVYMLPDKSGNSVDKGLAFLKETEIALGDLDSLKAILDVRAGSAPGIAQNEVLAPLLNELNADEMFWFAGDTATILSRAPADTPLGPSLSAVQNIVGTLNLTEAISGKVVATARDEEAARRLTDVVRGLVALGELAGEKNPLLVELVRGISVTQDRTQIRLVINLPMEVLDKLEQAKPFRRLTNDN